MSESGPIKKVCNDRKTGDGFYDYVPLGRNVWRATEGDKYCLLKTAADGSASSAELLRREYELSRDLQHPFIVGTSRFDTETEKGPAIVMEYVAGRTLREFVGENPSSSKRSKVLMQILEAVEYLHRKGILHNDIKPENIMVTNIGDDVKIIDFGLSETNADFLNRRLGGTKGASAPEVIDGDTSSSSTGSSDIYSIGGIISLLFPRKYIAIVRKCHRICPADRYKDIFSLRRAIEWRNRRPWLFLAFAIVCVLLAVSIIPERLLRIEEQSQEDLLQSKIRQIQNDMTVFYEDAADSINNRTLVPYQEFGLLVRNTFTNRTAEYRSHLDQEMLPICDSIYTRMIRDLTKMLLYIPEFDSLNLPREEWWWYHNLFVSNKPYAPFVK